MFRLRFVLLCASFALATSAHAQSGAQTTLIVPFPAGGSLDTLGRTFAQKLQDQTKETYVVDNRPGANGLIGSKVAASAKPDGKTWLFAEGTVVAVNPFLYAKEPGFDPEKDLRVVRGLASQPSLLVVNPSVPAKTLKEFLDYAKKGELNYASGGIGSAGHLTMELFGNVAGLKLNHIAYKGGAPAMADLIGGQVPAAFVAAPNALPHVRSGKLVPIAVSGKQRYAALPNVPTVAESGFPGFEVETAYFGWLPGSASPDVVKQVDGRLAQAIADPAVQERLRAAGMEPLPSMDSAAALRWLNADKAKWEKMIREKGIKAQ